MSGSFHQVWCEPRRLSHGFQWGVVLVVLSRGPSRSSGSLTRPTPEIAPVSKGTATGTCFLFLWLRRRDRVRAISAGEAERAHEQRLLRYRDAHAAGGALDDLHGLAPLRLRRSLEPGLDVSA